MTLQAKLTLGSVLVATLIVSLISAVDLANDMELQFDATLERADLLSRVATRMVRQTLNRQRSVPLREALRDPDLSNDLVDIMTASHALLEVAVVNPNNEILADSDPNRLGITSQPYPDFKPLVERADWREKLRVLLAENKYYQLQQSLGTPEGVTLLYVRVIIDPALIRNDIVPTLKSDARLALFLVAGAVAITFLFSALAFRPLGQLDKTLDALARGEFVSEKSEKGPPKKPATDELSIMASKVSMLGQRLRGAQYDVSDLRGNIDRLFQDLEDAVFIFNREGRLVFASGSVEKFLGKERADLAGQSLGEVFPPATTLGLMVARATQTGRSVRNRRVPLSAPGESPAGLAVVLLSVDMLESLPGAADAGAGVLVRLRDPEAQRKLGRELQTADRLSAISRISGGVAHEVKNPLNAILLHVEVARAKLARGDTDVSPQMEIISREILRLDRVVKTFLDFTRPVELSLSNVPLQDLVSEIVDLARPQADASRIRVNVQQDSEGAELRVDRDLFKQAVLNVVVNAMQAMPEGGELRFESFVTEDTAEIRVSDTGAGIPPELREKIFRLYFSTKKEGSGIGLAMTFRIVQLHDGTIDFTSEPGKGTTFFIRLPIAA
ncbi:MAG TPA: ATP-binding protein [Bryobacteraceae bacterium]|nr:ATP-binding protein [Bryobacteraceae bacterium]